MAEVTFFLLKPEEVCTFWTGGVPYCGRKFIYVSVGATDGTCTIMCLVRFLYL
jgi:hypothetical protein